MIRFTRIFELSTEADERRFEKIARLFRAAFPHEPEAFERIAAIFREQQQRTFEPILLVSSGRSRQVTGLAFVYYFPELRYGYLQYIASDPDKPSRGIGAAL